MSVWLKILVLFILVSFWGCEKEGSTKITQSKEKVSNLMKNADDSKYTLKERLAFVKKADSLCMLLGYKPEHLSCQRLIGTLYMKCGNSNLAQMYFLRTAELARNLSDYETEGVAFNNLGILYNARSSYDSALQFYREANQIFRNKGYKLRQAQGLVNMGIVYKNQSNFDEAFKSSLAAARIFDSLHAKKDLAAAYTTMGNVLKDLNSFDDALQYHQLALQIRNTEKDSAGMAATLHNIANVYRIKREYQKALVNYQAALDIKENLGLSKTIAVTVDNLGEVYFDLLEYDKAEEYFKRALTLRETNQDKDGILTTSNKLTKLYLAMGEVEKAKTIALNTFSITPQSGFFQPRLDNVLMLDQIYLRLKQYPLAAGYASLGIALKDSVFNSEMAKTVSQLNVKYKTEQKEKELLLAGQLQSIQSNQLHTQRSFIIFLVIFVLLLSCLLFLLFHSNKRVRQANHKVETLMNELNHRVKNNLQLVSDMLHLQLGKTEDESQTILIQTSINRVESMNIIHRLLYKKGFNRTIDMKSFIEALVSNLAHTYEEKSYIFETSINIQNLILDIDKAISLGLIVNELITNIYKYANPIAEETNLKISLTEDNKNCQLEVIDNCEYWNIQEVRSKKSGLGLFLIETLVVQLKGNWVSTSDEKGTVQCIVFNK